MRKFWDRKNDGDERRVGGRRRSFSGAHKGRGLNVPPSPHLTPTLKNSGSAYGACAVSLFCFFVRGNERTFHFTLLRAEVCCISLRVHDLVSLQLSLQVFRVSLFCFFRCFFFIFSSTSLSLSFCLLSRHSRQVGSWRGACPGTCTHTKRMRHRPRKRLSDGCRGLEKAS